MIQIRINPRAILIKAFSYLGASEAKIKNEIRDTTRNEYTPMALTSPLDVILENNRRFCFAAREVELLESFMGLIIKENGQLV
jgi:hypothetical protein